jgi:deazaflavin-dependent oxidoreductase (nitroreductase family)
MAKTYRMSAFTRFGNTMSAAMIRLGLGPAGMQLLTIKGRKTGLPRTTPVNLIEHQGRRWLVAPYGEVSWVRNARAAGEVELRRGRAVTRAHVQEATAEQAAPVLGSYLRQLRFVVGSYFDAAPSDPDAAFAAEAARHPVFLLTGTR